MTLRQAEWISIVVGAVGSIGLTLYVGGGGLVLMTLFVGWVSLPYVAVAWFAYLRVWALVLAPISLAIYARIAFGPPRAQPAFAFLMVPLASWVVIGIAAVVTRQRGKS